MLSCLRFFVCLKWTVSEEGRRGGGITWKLSGLLKWVSCILCLSSGNQIFIFLLGLMECFYLYILLVLDVLCKGKPELQIIFFFIIVLRAWYWMQVLRLCHNWQFMERHQLYCFTGEILYLFTHCIYCRKCRIPVIVRNFACPHLPVPL